ncbi:phage virion morphogenesis (putative tail completion) protein [Andreprevotia lacus DSM 23236]|jgi:phage virion morphogenesis protein|uniref:Phage virion morphogenesis (Putative tail completion) protein n=1 Tax=Andreprevotia lacus DSM 23236 TaxID=1121001 RepID=A0A1W1XK61_9NEIS|nr:phage virion morphogenesis protein [Andreprevotia lacus]SMC24212.1 phage virion morphogenesis (putative tail completion) protein [Andreprevotia lacus DSM 23236]
MPAADIDDLHGWAGTLLAKLQPAERRKLSRQIATTLRQGQAARIASQKNPDGTPYVPRKHLRRKKGRIARVVFLKLRKASHLKANGNASEASVGFSGRDAGIARQHQAGGAKLPRRGLLGFTKADRERIKDQVLAVLAR